MSSKKMIELKKLFAIIGIIAVVTHMTYFAFRPYGMLLFFLGFGVIYLVFVVPMKHLNKN